jgi:WD40 repeat protein
MSTFLPVPLAARPLAAAPRSSVCDPSVARRALHWRRPRLERVTCLSYGGRLLAAAGGLVCCVWDTRTHQLVRRIVMAEPITAVWMGHDGASLAVAAGEHVAVHDIGTGERRFGYSHGAALTSVHIDDVADVLGSADESGRVDVRDLASGRLMQQVQSEPGRPIVFVYRGHYVLIGSETHSAIVDATTGELLRRFPYEPDEEPAMDSLLLGSTLVAYSGTLVRWFDCARHQGAHCVRDLGSKIQSIDVYDGGGLALAATEAGGLHVFDLTSGEQRARHQSFTCLVLFARFGAGASLYVAGGEALVMHLVDGQHVRSYIDETPPLVAMTTDPGGTALLLSNRDGGVVRMGLRDGRRQGSFEGHAGSVSVVACGGDVVATGAYDGTMRLIDAQLRPTATIDFAQGPVQSIALDLAAGRVWAGTWAGKVNVVDLPTRRVTQTIDAFSSSVRTLTRDAVGERLCAGGDDGELCVFDLRNAMTTLFRHRLPGTVYRALFDGDGNLWATADDGVRRYDGTDPRKHVTFQGSAVRWFELHGGRLYSLSLAGRLAVFDVASGDELHRTVIESPVYHRCVLVLSRDRIVTASADLISKEVQPLESREAESAGRDRRLAPDEQGWNERRIVG